MSDIEPWFIFAVASALIGGFGAFANKITAQRKYDSELVLLINAITSIVILFPLAIFFEGYSVVSPALFFLVLISGMIATSTALMKVYALHYIDSAIFLPLFKVVGPIIVIGFGVLFFNESFTSREWFGLMVSLLVPLLLISKMERLRQNNLNLGIILIFVAAAVSSVIAVLQKYATEIAEAPLWIVAFSSLGMFVSSTLYYFYKHRRRSLEIIRGNFSKGVFMVGMVRTVFAGGGFYLTILAYTYGGPLGVVYTINSLYILPPIILAIVFYNEHWNMRKVFAIVLSIAALALLH